VILAEIDARGIKNVGTQHANPVKKLGSMAQSPFDPPSIRQDLGCLYKLIVAARFINTNPDRNTPKDRFMGEYTRLNKGVCRRLMGSQT